MAWLLDTNILSERRKPKPEPRVTALYDAQPLNTLYISVVSIAEIRFGIELQEDVTRRAALNGWLTRTLRPAFVGRSPCNGRDVREVSKPPATPFLPRHLPVSSRETTLFTEPRASSDGRR